MLKRPSLYKEPVESVGLEQAIESWNKIEKQTENS